MPHEEPANIEASVQTWFVLAFWRHDWRTWGNQQVVAAPRTATFPRAECSRSTSERPETEERQPKWSERFAPEGDDEEPETGVERRTPGRPAALSSKAGNILQQRLPQSHGKPILGSASDATCGVSFARMEITLPVVHECGGVCGPNAKMVPRHLRVRSSTTHSRMRLCRHLWRRPTTELFSRTRKRSAIPTRLATPQKPRTPNWWNNPVLVRPQYALPQGLHESNLPRSTCWCPCDEDHGDVSPSTRSDSACFSTILLVPTGAHPKKETSMLPSSAVSAMSTTVTETPLGNATPSKIKRQAEEDWELGCGLRDRFAAPRRTSGTRHLRRR